MYRYLIVNCAYQRKNMFISTRQIDSQMITILVLILIMNQHNLIFGANMNQIIIEKRNIESINVGIGTCLCHVILVKTTITFSNVPFRTYRQGMHDLKVWPDMLPDPSSNSTTPGKSKDHKDQMSKLAKVMRMKIYRFPKFTMKYNFN